MRSVLFVGICGALALAAVACSSGDGGIAIKVGDSDEDQIRATLEKYTDFIDAEDWDSMCDLFAEAVRASGACDLVRQGIEALAFTAGTSDVKADLNSISILSLEGEKATVKYDQCVTLAEIENCAAETVEMLKENGVWKVGLTQ